MAEVRLQGVKKRFGSTEVLSGVDLTIPSGEFVVFVGPSGCGKSTLLRIVAGLEEATEGEVWIDGRPVDGASPKARGVAMVFQSYALYPHMTVRENIAFPLKLSRVPAAEIKRRVAEAATLLGVEAHLDKKPGQLSGGQKQRVAIGRAMVRNPRVFLFDEPLSNLDAQLRGRMRSEISLLHRRLGCTVVYVTHDQVEAMTLADRIVVLNQGSVEQVGSPLELYRSPRTRFVASFIGTPSMNFCPSDALPLPRPPGRAKSVGFRPEHTRLSKGEGEWLRLGDGKVALVEMLGETTHVHAQWRDHVVVAEVRTELAPRRDGQVELWIRPDDLFFFDGTGRRIAIGVDT